MQVEITRSIKTKVTLNTNSQISGTLTENGANLLNKHDQEIKSEHPDFIGGGWSEGDLYEGQLHDLMNRFGPTLSPIFKDNILTISDSEVEFPLHNKD